jgi:Fe-S-cluster containining protein
MNVVVPKNVHFDCQRCARCCGDTSHRGRNLLLTDEDVERICRETDLNPLSFASPISDHGLYHYRMKKRNGKCVFLEGKACRIYQNRPLVCRFYPFSLEKRKNKYVFDVCDECPGVGLGEVVPDEEFDLMLKEAQERLKST